MDFRRLVVWIATGILGFQGVTLGLGLLHCLVLSGLHVNRHLQVQPALGFCDSSQQRIDDAVSQGIGLLAGLALGGSALAGQAAVFAASPKQTSV